MTITDGPWHRHVGPDALHEGDPMVWCEMWAVGDRDYRIVSGRVDIYLCEPWPIHNRCMEHLRHSGWLDLDEYQWPPPYPLNPPKLPPAPLSDVVVLRQPHRKSSGVVIPFRRP